MFLSQYFSFALSVSFHQCSIPIQSPTTHAVQCFSPSTSVFTCQYYSTNAPNPFIHLPPTLYNVSLPVLQLSPVSIIPPMLHSFIYHPHYIMLLSQYFSFPCQYHSTNIPYPFIYLPPTLYNVSLPVLQFPLSVSFHNAPYPFIHLPPTPCNVSLPVLQFPLSVSFHQCSIPIHSPTTHTI